MDKQRQFPHVIAITSGKGGVGKSSIAVNLGISLAKTGARVCIFDADTGLANINILLGLMPQFSLEHVLFGAKTIEEVMLEAPYGLKVIPGANGISECVSLHPRQQLRLTRELGRIENDFDYLLLDTAAGIADTTLDFVGSAHQTMLVVTPEPTSLTDAFSLIKLMHRRRSAMHYQVVVNMCSNVAQAREVFHRFAAAVEKYIGVRPSFLGHLLRDESLRVAVTLQSPVALFPDTDPSSRSFMRLTDALRQAVDGHHPTTGFTGFWQRQFRQEQENRQREAQQQTQPPPQKHEAAQRGGDGQRPQVVAAPTAIAPPPSVGDLARDLQHRIADPEVTQDAARLIVEDLHQSYMNRFTETAIAPLALLDALLALPERNDDLLRTLAARLQPWRAEPPPLLTQVEAPDGEQRNDGSHGNGLSSAGTGGDNPHAEAKKETKSVDAKRAETNGIDNSAAEPPVAANESAANGLVASDEVVAQRRPVPHGYDERRFGSQQALLELLQRQRDSGKSAMSLIEIILN
jgi:MinD-like ATPase involved in chromosome partitioning or flagellar assembly